MTIPKPEMVRAGTLRHRVTIEQLPVDAGTDDAGAPLNAWQFVYASLPARIKPLMGRELVAAQQVADGATVEIELRYVPGITAKMRATNDEDGTIYDILAVVDEQFQHRRLILTCSSGLTQG